MEDSHSEKHLREKISAENITRHELPTLQLVFEDEAPNHLPVLDNVRNAAQDSENREVLAFLHASMQLLQRQSDIRQDLRKSWQVVQKLHSDRHIDIQALKVLRVELGGMLEALHIDERRTSRKDFEYAPSPRMATLGSFRITSIGPPTSTPKQSPLLSLKNSVFDKERPKSPELVPNTTDPSTEYFCILFNEKGRLQIRLNAVEDTEGSAADQTDKKTRIFGKFKSPSFAWLVPDAAFSDRVEKGRNQIMVDLHSCFCEELPVIPPTIYRFKLCTGTGVEHVFETISQKTHSQWVRLLNATCGGPLLELQRSLQSAKTMRHYINQLFQMLPISVPLSWIRRAIELREKVNGLARRNAKNIPMLQITRDFERDCVRLNGKLVCGNGATTGGVDELVRSIVSQVQQYEEQLGSDTFENGLSPLSPTSRLTHCREAKALSFAERVLRGSSRTQGGGDIYDAISILAANSRVTICPVSLDVDPVELTMKLEAGESPEDLELNVQAKITMQFKLTHADHFDDVDDQPTTQRIVQGSLERQFTYGHLTEPAHVSIRALVTNPSLK